MNTSWKEMDLMKILNMTDEPFSLIIDHGDNRHGTCIDSVLYLGQSYKSIHGYIALFICVFGTIANILNLIVLKEMSSPINRMLTALAFADMLVMLEYIPFAIHMYIIPTLNFSYPWALFVLFHSHFTQVFHTISIQLTLTMAIWRYVAIKCSTQSSSYCTFKRCNWCILASYTCPFFLCIPNYLTFAIQHKQIFFLDIPYSKSITNKHEPDKKPFLYICEIVNDVDCTKAIREVDKYVVDLSDMAKAHDGLLHGIHFWTFSVFIKLIPCVVLTVFMCWLLNTLYKAKKRHTMLQKPSDVKTIPALGYTEENHALVITKKDNYGITTNGNGCHGGGKLIIQGDGQQQQQAINILPTKKIEINSSTYSNKLEKNIKKSKNTKRSDCTSKMLVAVLCLFLLTEFPQGIMAFLSGLYGQEFFRYCYSTWAEVWDILALFNSSVNFVLYCFMSRQFRLQFQKLFKFSPNCITNCSLIPISTSV